MAAEEPDAATAALIAKMLQEENPYEDDIYGIGQDDSDDDDYGRPKKKRKKKKAPPPKAPKAPKEPKPPKALKPPSGPLDEDGNPLLSATGRAKRKDAGTVRQKARPWTDDEETKFREALALYGRDWKKCAAHVGTRDHRAFTSHAQKYFIRLCLQGKPLPRKVAESGEGYTLSGKPLDPNSAAAKQYGFKPDTLLPALAAPATGADQDASTSNPESLVDREVCATPVEDDPKTRRGTVASFDASAATFRVAYEDGGEETFDEASLRRILVPIRVEAFGGVLTAEASAALREARESAARDAEAAREAKAAAAKARADAREQKEIERLEKAAAKAAAKAAKVRTLASESPAKASSEPTEYARNRPKRERGSVVVGGGFRDADGGTLELHPMRSFAPGSPGDVGAQPFKLVVNPAAMLVMDLHAHLCTNEVIGYLGGSFDAETRTVRVDRAFPGRGLASGSDVEMDPVAEVELKAQVEAENMKVVGWYHSHPVFEPTPSGVDIDNQLNYQNLFRDATSGTEPFVGFIVGPYDLRLPTRVSAMTAFVAQRRKVGSAVEAAPYEVAYETTDEAPSKTTKEAMAAVVEQNAAVAGRVNPTELWRPFTNFTNSQPAGGPCTKLAKLRASLAARLPEETVNELEQEDILDAVAKTIQTSWAVDLGY